MCLVALIEAIVVALDSVVTAAGYLLVYYVVVGRWSWE